MLKVTHVTLRVTTDVDNDSITEADMVFRLPEPVPLDWAFDAVSYLADAGGDRRPAERRSPPIAPDRPPPDPVGEGPPPPERRSPIAAPEKPGRAKIIPPDFDRPSRAERGEQQPDE